MYRLDGILSYTVDMATPAPRPSSTAPPRRPRLRAKYDRRRQELVDRAARLFAEQGYRQTSIDDLVRATGLQRGGLYHYIESKQQLLLLIHEELMNPLLDQAEKILEAHENPGHQLRELMRVWVSHVASHGDHMTVFSEERRLVESDPEWERIRQLRGSFQDVLADVLRRGVKGGEFEIPDPEIALMALLGIVNHMPQWLDPEGRLSPAEVADRCIDLVLTGIASKPASAPDPASAST
jgi:AcrR family transcriptional regulator